MQNLAEIELKLDIIFWNFELYSINIQFFSITRKI